LEISPPRRIKFQIIGLKISIYVKMKQMKNKKIFTIGGATFDIFIKAHDHSIIRIRDQHSSKELLCLDYGGKVKIDEVHETYGGGATNTAVAFSRMGFDVLFVGTVGDDEYGIKVLENLKKEGVDGRYAKLTKRDMTAFSTILNTFEGDRTVLAYAGANMFFDSDDLPIDGLVKADWIFLNHLTLPKSKIPNTILNVLKKNPKIKLAWNPGHEQFEEGIKKWKELLSHTEILFVNKEEASLFTRTPYKLAGIKSDDPKCHNHLPSAFLPPYADDVCEIMYQFFKTGVKMVVITDGKNGAQASDGKRMYFCPVITHKKVDTLGAGDAFASGFASARILGKDFETALKYGTINANSVISFFGAQKGLLTAKEINKQMKRLDISVTSIKLN